MPPQVFTDACTVRSRYPAFVQDRKDRYLLFGLKNLHCVRQGAGCGALAVPRDNGTVPERLVKPAGYNDDGAPGLQSDEIGVHGECGVPAVDIVLSDERDVEIPGVLDDRFFAAAFQRHPVGVGPTGREYCKGGGGRVHDAGFVLDNRLFQKKVVAFFQSTQIRWGVSVRHLAGQMCVIFFGHAKPGRKRGNRSYRSYRSVECYKDVLDRHIPAPPGVLCRTVGTGMVLDRRGAVGMETLDGLQSPGLALSAVGLRPANRFPIRGEDQAGTGIGQFHPVAGGFPDIEKERALNSVFVRSCFDVDPRLEEQVGCAQDILPLVGCVGNVVQTTEPAAVLFGAGKVVGLVVDREPAATQPSVVELDILSHTTAEAGLHEVAKFSDVVGQQIQMVDPARRDTCEPAGRVLQGGCVARFGGGAARLVVDFEHMAERILETECPAMALVAIDPAMGFVSARLNRRHTPLQSLRRCSAIADMAHARRFRARQFERAELIIVPGAQIGAVVVPTREFEPEIPGEERQAFVEFISQHLDMAEIGQIEGLRGTVGHGVGLRVLWLALPPMRRWPLTIQFCACFDKYRL